jgi:hypothetical protein
MFPVLTNFQVPSVTSSVSPIQIFLVAVKVDRIKVSSAEVSIDPLGMLLGSPLEMLVGSNQTPEFAQEVTASNQLR